MRIILLLLVLFSLNFKFSSCTQKNYFNIFANSSDSVKTIAGNISVGAFGFSVSNAGDINGDGYQDVLISSLGQNARKGVVHVVYGGQSVTIRFTVTGESINDHFGISADTIGDINGDDIDDIAIGAQYVNSKEGAVYVIFGKRTGFSDIDLSSGLPLAQGFIITGPAANSCLGVSVTRAGDVNGDKIDDIVIGAHVSNSGRGAVYVIYGKKGGGFSNINLSSGLDPAQGFHITGSSSTSILGISVYHAGDFNGDGIDDIIMGSYGVNNYAGAVYVIYGKDTAQLPNIDLSSGLDAIQGFAIIGANSADYLGVSVAGGQDLNGDGVSDIVMGAYNAKNGAGVAYVFGKKGGLSSITLSSGLDLTQGYVIEGSILKQRIGSSVRFAGDINRDGIVDLIIGSFSSVGGTGRAYVVFGNKKVSGNISLSEELSQGYTIYGVAEGDAFGRNVNGIGDLNNDGIDDIIIGSPGFNTSAGAAYIIYSPYLCPDNCAKCSWSWVCQQCEPGYGFYNDNSECIICPKNTILKDGFCVEPALAEVIKTATTMSAVSSITSRIFSVGSSFSVGLGLIAKIIQNVRYLNISYSDEAKTCFENYNSELFDFTIPTYFLESTETKSLAPIYLTYELQPTFLENYLQSIILMFASLCFVVPVQLLLRKQERNHQDLYHIILKQMNKTAMNFLIIQVYSNLDDIIFYLILDIKSTEFSSAYAVVSLLVGVLFLLTGLAFCCFNYWILFKYQTLKTQEGLLAKFKRRFEMVSTFFQDFKDGSVFQQSFFALLILRSAALMIIIVVFEPPLVQAIVMMSINVIFCLYLVCKRPFESKLDEITQYFCELSIFAAYTCVLIDSILDHNNTEATGSREGLGKSIILAGTILSLGGFVIQVIQILSNIYQGFKFVKNYYGNKQKRIPVSLRVSRMQNRNYEEDNSLQQIHLNKSGSVINQINLEDSRNEIEISEIQENKLRINQRKIKRIKTSKKIGN